MINPILNAGPVDGQRIGIFGGSFNPPHRGHLEVSLCALKRLELDWIWWMVSPQNPLKDASETGDFAERLAAAHALASHPRIVVTDLEHRLATRTTAETLRALAPLLRRGRFVWIMGADSFAGLHRWHEWEEIPARLALAVFDRPGFFLSAVNSPAARRLARWRVDEAEAADLAFRRPPAWAFLRHRLWRESSTEIRRARRWPPAMPSPRPAAGT